MKTLISILVFVLMAGVASAYDFYGASVTVKEVPTSMWRMGINGNYPVIVHVESNSPASKAGLTQGNIIISVNDKRIKSVSDFDTFTTNTLSVKVVKGFTRAETIVIDKIAIETEKAKRIAEKNMPVVKASAENKITVVEEASTNSAPIVLNDEILEKKLGKNDYTTRRYNTKSSRIECVKLLDNLIKIIDSKDKYCSKEQRAFNIFNSSGCGEDEANSYARGYLRTLKDGCICEEAFLSVNSNKDRILSNLRNCITWDSDRRILKNAINSCSKTPKLVGILREIYNTVGRSCGDYE